MRGFLGLSALILAAAFAPAVERLELIHQDFSRDPGWDHYQNRVIGVDMPRVHQDFGWRPTNRTGTGGGSGEIGGRVENSRRRAYYAMPLGRPLSFDDDISASGSLALSRIGLRGVGYVGFFNSTRHTWRVWNSLAFRVWEEDGVGQVMFDWMSADWKARGAETAILINPDGRPRRFSLHYEPDARADPLWRDKPLERLITDREGNGQPYELQGEEHLFERLKREEPGLTREDLRRRLLALRDQGLVEYFHRHDMHRWWKRPDAGAGHGRVTLGFDDETPYVFWFDEEIRRSPASFDRFGLFNIARFGTGVEIHLGDLTVNGQKIDLSQDPHWEGRNNESQYVEPNFQAAHSFGWSQTNWAGERPGEIGGLFWRTEPPDPLCAYYADKVGELTLDDPIAFSGSICFTEGMTDAAAYFGYFNRDNQVAPFDPANPRAFAAAANMMGVGIADSSAVGYNFKPQVSSRDREATSVSLGAFVPDRRRRRFTFDYDPAAGDGRVVATLDDRREVFDLTAEQRRSGATFNRFGLANIRAGGHSVEFYLDDLTYTARGPRPKPVPQTTIEVPYPHEQAGRRY